MWRIWILQRGWLYVGKESREGDEYVLRDASVIHRWGTTEGIGELQKGPTKDTVLHPCSLPVRAHYLVFIARMDCSAEGWEK